MPLGGQALFDPRYPRGLAPQNKDEWMNLGKLKGLRNSPYRESSRKVFVSSRRMIVNYQHEDCNDCFSCVWKYGLTSQEVCFNGDNNSPKPLNFGSSPFFGPKKMRSKSATVPHGKMRRFPGSSRCTSGVPVGRPGVDATLYRLDAWGVFDQFFQRLTREIAGIFCVRKSFLRFWSCFQSTPDLLTPI